MHAVRSRMWARIRNCRLRNCMCLVRKRILRERAPSRHAVRPSFLLLRDVPAYLSRQTRQSEKSYTLALRQSHFPTRFLVPLDLPPYEERLVSSTAEAVTRILHPQAIPRRGISQKLEPTHSQARPGRRDFVENAGPASRPKLEVACGGSCQAMTSSEIFQTADFKANVPSCNLRTINPDECKPESGLENRGGTIHRKCSQAMFC
jgi:hypothetical protein